MKLAVFLSVKRILAGVVFSLFAAGSSAPLLQSAAPRSNSNDSLSQMKSWAESQHEIVMLHLQKKEFEKAAIEANKIFDMDWPESEEILLLKELHILSERFLGERQASLALQIIEKNFKKFKKKSSQIEILKEQGYLYKNLKQHDKELECFRKAQELERKN
jgi:tetratricopeptide (TPR) repeat protein